MSLMNREITTHHTDPVNNGIRIEVMDEPGPGGASHHYRVEAPIVSYRKIGQTPHGRWDIEFQKGGGAEVGINGLTNEVLLAIVKDRLEAFQAGPFPSEFNRSALYGVDLALTFLKSRSLERIARGVEGKAVV